MTKPLALAILLALGTATEARAGYDKTEWGMDVAEVQKLYPGGVVDRQPDGKTEYRVLREVAGIRTAMLRFDFGGPKNGLRKVTILFPEQGTEVDLRQALFEPPSPAQGEAVRLALRAALISKYGKPAATNGKDDAWITASGDQIYLGLTSGGGGVAPGLVYEPPKKERDTTGL